MFFQIQQRSSLQQQGPPAEITTATTKDMWHLQTSNQNFDYSGVFSVDQIVAEPCLTPQP